ncbi:hypothetical protein TGAM01_v203404 [Trichoderma gamsii]|uniref:Uncharacterized protein n=1 Tax=Trichoderma gamsii TaxID=398673 RepID=A0A2P4ZTL4_9HYPO|nr:hypothetical protein TGAM01_v203404 [Trichoderma gamsii]PON27637.1 hypothetical protein TGAM01_v203404 [Trichoderma gamsii]
MLRWNLQWLQCVASAGFFSVTSSASSVPGAFRTSPSRVCQQPPATLIGRWRCEPPFSGLELNSNTPGCISWGLEGIPNRDLTIISTVQHATIQDSRSQSPSLPCLVSSTKAGSQVGGDFSAASAASSTVWHLTACRISTLLGHRQPGAMQTLPEAEDPQPAPSVITIPSTDRCLLDATIPEQQILVPIQDNEQQVDDSLRTAPGGHHTGY